MRITGVTSRILRLPLGKSLGLPMSGADELKRPTVQLLLAEITTDSGAIGHGFVQIPTAMRSLNSAIDDELTPLLIGEDARRHERLWAKVHAVDSPAAWRAYAAVDIALWDLKGKAQDQALWRMLGGARDSAKAFSGEAANASLATDDVIAAGRAAMSQGVAGLRVAIRGIDPEGESHQLVAIREALGDDVWFAISVENPMDYETALPMVRFIEEEIGADWFEDPLAEDDFAGYARLAARIDTPLAGGSRFTSPGQFLRLLETDAPITLRPDAWRLGGLTPLLKVATLAELHRRPLVPRLAPEIAVHLACGLPYVNAVDYVPWFSQLKRDPLVPSRGMLVAPESSGLGLELDRNEMIRLTV